MQDRTGYSRLEIWLHWLTAVLVLGQYVLHDGIVLAFDVRRETEAAAFTPQAVVHMVGGALILGLAIWRLALRSERPPLDPPAGEPSWAAWIAPLVHRIFYILLIALPVTGGLAWGMPSEFMGDLHEALRAALLFLIVAHLGAVLLHALVWRTGVLSRMTRPSP